MKSNPSFSQLAKPLITLMLPMLGTQLAQTGMGVVDTIIAGMAGTPDLAAIAVGSSIWLPLVLFVSGVMVALSPIVAQAKGAKDKQASATALQQGLYLATAIGIAGMMLLFWGSRPLMEIMEVDHSIQDATEQYLIYIAYGLPAVAIYQALRSYNEAIGLVQPVTIIAFVALLLNIPLNILFVFGYGPIEAMGGPGCGVASLIVFYLTTVALLIFTLVSKHHQKVKPLQHFNKPCLNHISRISAIGFPIGLAIFVEVSLFCVIALLIAGLGANVVAAHQIAINVSSLLFMVPLSLAYALTVRIGQELGQGQVSLTQAVWKNALKINLLFAFLNGAIVILLRHQIVALYSDDAMVTTLAAHLLLFAAIYQISDALQVAAAGALRGYKDTLVTLILTIISFWLVGLPLGYYLGLSQSAPLGAEGFWIGLVVGLSVNAALLLIRLRQVTHQHLHRSEHNGRELKNSV